MVKQNPTFGLTGFGPLVPASDCKSCLYTLTALQALVGATLLIMPGKKLRMAQPNFSPVKERLMRIAGVAAGSMALYHSMLETLRLQLPVDPWVDDAARARKEAERRGEKVSIWFGPKNHTPLSFEEWKRQSEENIKSRMERVKYHHVEFNSNNNNNNQGGERDSEQEASRMDSMYIQVRDQNRSIADSILEQLQEQQVRFDVLPEVADDEERYMKDNAALLEDLKDEDVEWDVMEPWEQLEIETDISVRLMPHSRDVGPDSRDSVHTFHQPVSSHALPAEQPTDE